jgi:hypothetical protein
MKRGFVIAAALVALGAAGVSAPAAANEPCLQVGQIKVSHMVDPQTMQITSMRNEHYTMHFTGACHVGNNYPHNHFVYTDLQVGSCFSAGDALPTSELDPCFIESVSHDD